jgi:dihydrofolate reductase
VTYEGFAQAWPSRTDEVGFADKMNSMRKYVVSTRLEHPEWNNTQVIKGDLAGEVARIKQQLAGDVLVNGSATLVSALIADELVDEYRLMVFPVVLGDGKRLFNQAAQSRSLRLVETKPAAECLILIYEPQRVG